MPVYEYACTACGERTEARQGFDDAPLEECPHCGGKLRKLYSPVGIVFRGSGFYSTDGKRLTASGEKSKTDDKPSDKPDTAPKKESKADKKESTTAEKST